MILNQGHYSKFKIRVQILSKFFNVISDLDNILLNFCPIPKGDLKQCYTVKGFNFTVLKFRGFLDGYLSRGF